MRFFSKARKAVDGWLAFRIHEDGVSVAHVTRATDEKPSVEFVKYFLAEKPITSAALDKIAKDIHAENYKCSTLLGSGEYQILTVEAPTVPPDELKTAIRWRLKDLLDYHIDDATIDVMDIPVDKNAPTRTRSMFAVAARNNLIRSQQELFAQAKIPLTVIDLPEMAQRNIAQFLEPPGRGLAMLSFDDTGGLLTVTYAGELYLARHIDMPVAQLTQADEARRNESFDRVTLELQRSLDHFDRQFHYITMSKLLLGPLGDAQSGLQQHLASNLYLPVDSISLNSVFNVSKVPDLLQVETQQRFFLTVGAALRLEEKVL